MQTMQNGVIGRLFTDKITGNSLFLPAIGRRDSWNGGALSNTANGYYWSSTGEEGSNRYAHFVRFTHNETYFATEDRDEGYLIRSVAEN